MKFVFVNGRVAIVVRYWDEPPREEEGWELEGGARVDIRRVDQVEGPGHREGAAGFVVQPVSEGIWRADLFVSVSEPGKACFHQHPLFESNDVGDRDFDQDFSDPRRWIADQLSDLPGLLTRAGAAELIPSLDLGEHQRALPLMLLAVDSCLAQIPQVVTSGKVKSPPIPVSS